MWYKGAVTFLGVGYILLLVWIITTIAAGPHVLNGPISYQFGSSIIVISYAPTWEEMLNLGSFYLGFGLLSVSVIIVVLGMIRGVKERSKI